MDITKASEIQRIIYSSESKSSRRTSLESYIKVGDTISEFKTNTGLKVDALDISTGPGIVYSWPDIGLMVFYDPTSLEEYNPFDGEIIAIGRIEKEIDGMVFEKEWIVPNQKTSPEQHVRIEN